MIPNIIMKSFINLKIIQNNKEIILDKCIFEQKCIYPLKLSKMNSQKRKEYIICNFHTKKKFNNNLIILLKNNHKTLNCLLKNNAEKYCQSCITKSRFIFAKNWNECYICKQKDRKYLINNKLYDYWDYPCEHKINNISNDKFLRILIYIKNKNYNYFVRFLLENYNKEFKFKDEIIKNINKQNLREIIFSMYKKPIKEFYVDLETNSYKKLLKKYFLEPSTYLYGFMEKNNNPNNDWIWFNFNNFLEYFQKIKTSQKWLIHNLSFDGRYFIKNVLKELGYFSYNSKNLPNKNDIPKNHYWFLIDDENILYKGYIKNKNGNLIELECTFLKLNISIKEMGNLLNKMKNIDRYKNILSKYQITKGNIDYKVIRSLNWTIENEPLNKIDKNYGKKVIHYLFTDLLIVKIFFELIDFDFNEYCKLINKNIKFEWKMTCSSTAVNFLKTNFFTVEKWNEYFQNKLTIDEFEIIRECYNGGVNLCTPQALNKKIKVGDKLLINNKLEIIEEINHIDINSSHANSYSQFKIPYGNSIYDCDNDNCNHYSYYYLDKVENLKINKNHFPIFAEKTTNNSKLYIYPMPNSFENRVFNTIKMKMFKQIYNGNYNFKKLFCFKNEKMKELDEFTKFLIGLKIYAQEIGNKVLEFLAKNLMNFIAGKMGQDIKLKWYAFDESLNIVKNDIIDLENEKLWYTPFADATTTYALLHLYNVGYQLGWHYITYADSDALIVIKKINKNMMYQKCIINSPYFKGNIFSQQDLGKWKFVYPNQNMPYKIIELRIFGKKKYYELLENGFLDIKTAGLPKEVIKMINNKDYNVTRNGIKIENNIEILDIQTKFTNMFTKNEILNGVHVFNESDFTYKNNHKSYFLECLSRWKYLDFTWKNHISAALPRFFKNLDKNINYYDFIENEYSKDFLKSFIWSLNNESINPVTIDIKQNKNIDIKDVIYYHKNFDKNFDEK